MTHGVNTTSIFTVDPRAADTFALPDTANGADPYDVRAHDRVTVLINNGTDQSVDVDLEQFAFNDEEATTEYPVDDVATKTIAAGETGELSVDGDALAFLRVLATFSTAPTSGTLTATYQSDLQG